MTQLFSLLLATVLLVVSTSAVAQEPPAGDGAWTLRVVTEGGITGKGRGSFLLTSTGDLTCSGRADPCSRTVSDDDVRQVAAMVGAIAEAAWVRHPAPTTCSDCFVTTVTLRTRDGGEVRTRTARWDDSQAPGAVLRNLVERVIDLPRAPLR